MFQQRHKNISHLQSSDLFYPHRSSLHAIQNDHLTRSKKVCDECVNSNLIAARKNSVQQENIQDRLLVQQQLKKQKKAIENCAKEQAKKKKQLFNDLNHLIQKNKDNKQRALLQQKTQQIVNLQIQQIQTAEEKRAESRRRQQYIKSRQTLRQAYQNQIQSKKLEKEREHSKQLIQSRKSFEGLAKSTSKIINHALKHELSNQIKSKQVTRRQQTQAEREQDKKNIQILREQQRQRLLQQKQAEQQRRNQKAKLIRQSFQQAEHKKLVQKQTRQQEAEQIRRSTIGEIPKGLKKIKINLQLYEAMKQHEKSRQKSTKSRSSQKGSNLQYSNAQSRIQIPKECCVQCSKSKPVLNMSPYLCLRK